MKPSIVNILYNVDNKYFKLLKSRMKNIMIDYKKGKISKQQAYNDIKEAKKELQKLELLENFIYKLHKKEKRKYYNNYNNDNNRN